MGDAERRRAMNVRWTTRPEGSNWGDFGPDDQRGRLNLIDRAKVLQGIAEVQLGQVFCLSLPLELPGGNYHALRRRPPLLRPGQIQPAQQRPSHRCILR
jgi:hypothetical protein